MTTRLQTLSHWLRDAFDQTSFRLVPLSGDASFRRYWRLHLDQHTFVVMDAPPTHEDCEPFMRIGQQINALGLTTPRVEFANVQDGFLVLRDLGDDLYLDALNEDSAERLYEDAMRALICMQRGVDTSLLPRYDAAKLAEELELFPRWFLSQHLGCALDAGQRKIFDEAANWLIEQVLYQPQTFVHRDFHSRNLMVHQDNPAIIDFQDAVLGPVSYDLVSLFRDVYIRWSAPQIAHWQSRYCELAVAADILDSAQVGEFPTWFDVMGVQRHLKVAGIFARLCHRDGKTQYLRDLPLTLRYLLEVMEALPALQQCRELLLSFDLFARVADREREVLGAAPSRAPVHSSPPSVATAAADRTNGAGR